MTISVPWKLEVTGTVRAETSACTDSLAPGCCSRLISSSGVWGASLATEGAGAGFCRRGACCAVAAPANRAAVSAAIKERAAYLRSEERRVGKEWRELWGQHDET